MAAVELLTNVIIGGQTTSGFNALAGRLESLGATVDRIGSYVRDLEIESANIYRNYEDNMLAAEYALSAQYSSATELSRVMRDLDTYASQWAANSIFHTDDVSQAINEAAHAGWDYNKMVQGIPQAMLIAQAGGLELADGLDYLVKIMGATGTEFEQMGTVIDQWSMASNKSATNIGEMGEAFMSLGAAAQFGDSTAELFTLLAVLANVGTTGSQAGTALRGAMMRIIAPTTKAEDAMSLLGADADELNEILADENVTKAAKTLEGLGFSAYDAEGNLLPMIDIFQNLYDVLQGVDEQAQNEILAAIFPTRNVAAAKAFLAAVGSGEMMDIYGAVMNSEGYAAKGAEIMMSGMTGSIETLLSKWEEFERSIGETLAPVIETVADWLGNIVDSLNNMDEGQLASLVGGMTTLAATGPALMVVGGAVKLFTALGPWGTAFLVAAVGAGALAGYMMKMSEINFESHFGDMELDLDELGAHVDSLTTSFDGQMDAISEWEGALTAAEENYANKSSQLSELLLTDVLMGKKLTDADKQAIYDYADEIYQAVYDGIENAEATDLTFLQAIFGDRSAPGEEDMYNMAVNVVGNYYDGVYAEAYAIGEEIRQQMTAALADGELDEMERQAIMASVDRFNQIEAEISNMLDSEAYYTQLYKAQHVSWDSISDYMTENAGKMDNDLAELEEAYAIRYGHYRNAFEYAIENGTEFEDLYGNTYTVTEDDWADFEAQLEREKEADRQEIIDKYGRLDAAAFDALMNDSDMSEGWNYLKWMRQNGISAYDENGRFNWAGLGFTPETDEVLPEQLSDIAAYNKKLRGILEPFADDPEIAAYIQMLDDAEGVSNAAALYTEQYANYLSTGLDPYELFTPRSAWVEEQLTEAQQELARQQDELARIDAEIAEREGRINGINRPEGWATNGGRIRDEEALYGIISGGNLYERRAEVELDIEAAQERVDTLEGQIENLSMAETLTVTAELDASEVENYTPTPKTMRVTPYILGQTYAEGGRATEPSIFGEVPGQAEWAIPEAHTERTAALLNAAREASGFTWGDLISRFGGLNANPGHQSLVLHYSPTINAENADGVAAALAADKARLMKMIREAMAEQKLRDEVEVYA